MRKYLIKANYDPNGKHTKKNSSLKLLLISYISLERNLSKSTQKAAPCDKESRSRVMETTKIEVSEIATEKFEMIHYGSKFLRIAKPRAKKL